MINNFYDFWKQYDAVGKTKIQVALDVWDACVNNYPISSQLEPPVSQKIADLKEALTIALSLWKIAHSPIGVTQDAMVEYKRRIDKLTEIVYPK